MSRMSDIHAAIAEALEARLSLAEQARDSVRYAVAYAAHHAFVMGEDPGRAARLFVTNDLSPVVEGADPLTARTDPIGRAAAEVAAILHAISRVTRGAEF